MIAWLHGWLKEIILIVLLAAFVDLLLPNNAFQRYVKTVLGLFILLTLLSPLLALFREKWDSQKLLASVEQIGTEMAGADAFGSMKSLQAILTDADRWRQDDRAEAQRLMERQLASELQISIGTAAKVAVKQVKLQMNYDNNGTPSIKHMQVVLDLIDEVPAAGSPPGEASARKPIGAVQPVHIEIQVGKPEPKRKDAGLTPEQLSAKQKIYEQLNRQWRLNRDEVTLLFETELGKER